MRWRRFYKLFRNWVERAKGDWRSKVSMPYVFSIIETITPKLVAQIPKFLVVPIGFVCDHTEILFDIDVQAAGVAREFSSTLRRTASLNTSPTFIAMIADLVRGIL